MKIFPFFGKPQRFEFVADDQGRHWLGGEVPDNFRIPSNEFPGGIQYLGKIDNSDPVYSWLPFNLHIIYPIYLNARVIYLDYQNPDRPEILNVLTKAEITTEYDDLTLDSSIIFQRSPFSIKNLTRPVEDMEIIGVGGAPIWVNGKAASIRIERRFKFVAQLMSSDLIPVVFKNFTCQDIRYQDNFRFLHFWEDGDLKIFFDPNDKQACLFIQNT
ncbi:MAG: hypothetical protein EOO88_01335 [Pedobacter sp.]|nr:MAG: hypothetical protein EOO88_01335 [Pedobacter sp.]